MKSSPNFSKTAFAALFARLSGSAVTLLFNIILARRLGIAGTGQFYLCVSVLIIASTIARVGQDKIVLRSLSKFAGEGGQTLGESLALGSVIVIFSAVACSIFLFSTSDFFAFFLFDDELLSRPMRLMSATVIPITLVFFFSDALRALMRTTLAVWFQSGMVNFCCLILLLALPNLISNVDSLMVAYLVSTLTSAILAFFIVSASGDFVFDVSTKIFSSLRRMVAEGSTLMMFALLMLLLTTLDTILLGIFSTADQVGEYGVASRLAMFISFVAFAANSVAEPQYARMYSQRQFGQIEVLVRKSEVFSLGTAMPLMVAFVVFGSDILASFGHAFRTAHSSLIILSVGHFLTLALAPAAGLLVMCNQSGAVRNAALVAVITNAGLNMLLVPSLGADGAAIATFCSVLVFHMVSAALVFKKLSLNPILGLPLRHQ